MASGTALNPSRQRPAPLSACPTPPESIAFPTSWYRLPNNDHFLICTKCYEDKLHSTPFASLLRCDYLDFGGGGGATTTCDFSTPRVDSLLRQAAASNDFRILVSFAERRMSIMSCSGTRGIKGGNGTKWFRPIDDAIPSFVCCEACYEDVVSGTSFGPNFVPDPHGQPADDTWSCDLAVSYLRRLLPECAERGDWHGFVQAGRHRISLPACVSGVSEVASAKRWFNTVRPSPIHNLTICEACYLDRAGWREDMARSFAPIQFSPHDFNLRFICDFQSMPMRASSDILLAHGMFGKWHQIASLMTSKPWCDKEGIVGGAWYGLADPTDGSRNVENFDICAACHAGWNQSADWGHLFRRLNYPPSATRVCDFNPSSGPRYSQYTDKWNQMYFTRDPSPFIDYVSRLASLSICQGTRRLENTTWYGDKDASLLICPSCFEEAVHGTHFASTFPLQNTLLPAGHHCSLYSSRMRDKYTEACKQRSLDSLLSFAADREQIYQQTIPHIEAFGANQQRKMDLLMVSHREREKSKQTAILATGFFGGNPIVQNFSRGITPQTLLYEHLRRDIKFDPQRPVTVQLEVMWKKVE